SQEINDSSVGLEHLLREVGQIYEALELTNSKEDTSAKLPEIAAELMVLGYPVELMDGDASYLPLRWVGAIFDSLIERLGDKRVFVLSVLGIQSTGKSTLLNAMFGFDVKTHIHYFAHLWEGNPPMAPPNPTYSQNVQQLKSKILQAAKQHSQRGILKLSTLKDRIGDLWNALRHENFVFSFKNSLEIAAYRKLESAFSQWTWRLRSHFLDVEMRLNNKIQNGDLQNVTRKHLEGLVQETSDAIEKEVEKYFMEDKDRETLVQWKSSTELKLKELKETLLYETKRKCENLIELQKEQNKLDAKKLEYEDELLRRSRELAVTLKGKSPSENKLDTKKLEYEDELLRRSRELAVTLKGKSPSEKELKDHFSLVWNSWIAEVSRAARPLERVDIDAEIEDVLLEHFKEPGFHAWIRSFPKDSGFSFDMEKHTTKRNLISLLQDVGSIFDAAVIKFQHITDDIIACVEANIDKKEQEKQDYSRNFIHEILNEIEPALRQAVFERTAKDIAEDMKSKLPDFRGNRANLEVCILRYLAEQENFEYFKQELTEVINLPRSDLNGIEHQEVTDIEFLSSAMAETLDDLRDRLMKEMADADLSSFSRPTQLEALYNGKFEGKGEIPDSWQRITKQEALSELEQR
ncbi:PREDICTED: interferon-induced very large GTPase 1-like, partial [Ficedula albicollis]|uniref:interferon-induced very large GTPase 1-like n=1 Tax=Ficedula albicollis TaxID=59894 RepID=UPI0007AD7DC7